MVDTAVGDDSFGIWSADGDHVGERLVAVSIPLHVRILASVEPAGGSRLLRLINAGQHGINRAPSKVQTVLIAR